MKHGTRAARAPSAARDPRVPASFAAALLISAAFAYLVVPLLGTLPWEYDEGTFIMQARAVAQGQTPFVDFFHHQPPLQLYLLAGFGKLFGASVFGYRLLSLASMALSGFLLFCLARPFTGAWPALIAQAVFLFSPSQIHALNAVTEPSMVLFTVLGVVLLFIGTGRWSARASAIAFVIALLIKPTCLVVVVAAVLSLAYGREWRRLRDLALVGIAAGVAGIAWTLVLSDGVLIDLLRYQAQRVGMRTGGLWSIDSGFPELRTALGVETRGEWARFCFRDYLRWSESYLPAAVFGLSLLGAPIWFVRCARSRPALGAFAVLWPAFYLLLMFVGLDYVSAKYFVPFLAFTSFLLAGVVGLAQRYLPPLITATAAVVVTGALAVQFAAMLERQDDPWYYGRADWISREYPSVVSFTPMYFAATGTEPGCGLFDPANTFGSFGEHIIGDVDPIRRFRVSDEALVACLRANPQMPVLIDFWFYFITRPGSAVRAYLEGEGSGQRLFFSPLALEQWDRPALAVGFVNR